MNLAAKSDRLVLEAIDRTADLIMDSHQGNSLHSSARAIGGNSVTDAFEHATRARVLRSAAAIRCVETFGQLRRVGSAHHAGIAFKPRAACGGAGRASVGYPHTRPPAACLIGRARNA